MNGIERLREYAESVRRGGECRILHAHHGDFSRECSERECDDCRAAYLRAIADEVERSALPEGMEWLLDVWPRWSNGDYCSFGDWWTADRYGEGEPRQLRRLVIYTPELLDEWEQGDGESYGYEWDFMRPSELDYRPDKVEPPAPAVLDADGDPLEVGQTVYGTRDLEPVEIVSLRSKEYDGVRTVKCKDRTGFVFYAPDDLTHQRPVLDADGVPIKKGDTVYVAPFDDPMTVRGFAADGRVLMDYHSDDSLGYSPERLTHERPESWERLEEDAGKNPFDYCKDVGHRLDTCENAERFKSRDIVRRCRALAKRGER